MATEASDFLSRFERLKADRGTWESLWQELADYLYPRRSNFTGKRTAGEKQHEKIFDSTPVIINELLASGLHGMLTNPSVQWFNLVINDVRFLKDLEVKRWLKTVTEIMFNEINRPQAVFSSSIHELYLEYSAFGTGVMFVMENEGMDGLVFSARALTENLLAEGHEGIIDTDYRIFEMTVRQLIQQWGDNVSPEVKKMQADDKLDEKIEIFHGIQPRKDFNPFKKDGKNKPILSIYIEKKTKHILNEGGFDETPFMAPRVSRAPDEIYGRGPGTSSLADIKMLNEMMKTTLTAAQKVVSPPLMAEDDSAIGPLKAIPNGVNYFRKGSKAVEAMKTSADIGLGEALMESVRERIRSSFFIDQLQLGQGPQMTATEVIQRTEEKLRLMGPMLGRLQTELLGPLIDRVFGILSRMGKFPTPPRQIAGANIDIEYTSPIARAQKTLDAQGLLRMIEIMSPLIQTNPAILDGLNGDKALAGLSSDFGVNPFFLNDDAAIANIREARAQEAQDAVDAELAMKNSKAAKDASAAVATV